MNARPTLLNTVPLIFGFTLSSWVAFGDERSGVEPTVFQEGVVGGSGAAFSPDGTAVYLHTFEAGKGHTITVSHHRGGLWTSPEVAEFSGSYDELEPAISHDGGRLVFASTRPVDGKRVGMQLWSTQKSDAGWAEPQVLPAPIVIPRRQCGSPSLATDGSLYFGARSGKSWPWGIFFSRFENGVYAEPVNLNEMINPGGRSWSHTVAPDQSFLIFSGVIDAATPRPDSVGEIDLYVSFREGEKWLPGVNLGSTVNTAESEVWPRISPDGRFLFFNREGPAARGIYQIAIAPLLAPLRRNNGKNL